MSEFPTLPQMLDARVVALAVVPVGMGIVATVFGWRWRRISGVMREGREAQVAEACRDARSIFLVFLFGALLLLAALLQQAWVFERLRFDLERVSAVQVEMFRSHPGQQHAPPRGWERVRTIQLDPDDASLADGLTLLRLAKPAPYDPDYPCCDGRPHRYYRLRLRFDGSENWSNHYISIYPHHDGSQRIHIVTPHLGPIDSGANGVGNFHGTAFVKWLEELTAPGGGAIDAL